MLLAALVDFANLSYPTTCAEEDNVSVEVRPATSDTTITSFLVTTTHPDYDYDVDHRDPDFTNCSMVPGDTDPPLEIKLYDDHETTAVWAVTEPEFWRPTAMTVRVGDEVATDVHYLRIIKKVADADSWPEVLVFYTDGNLRLKPHARVGYGDPIFGTSLQIGRSTDSSRPFADVQEATYDPATDRLMVTYASGDTATLSLEEISRTQAKVRVSTNFEVDPMASTAALRSMFVEPGNSDADHVRYLDVNGVIHDEAILDFLGAEATELHLAREEPSIHNTSAPDYLLSEFEVIDPAVDTPPLLRVGDATKVETDGGYSFFYFRVALVGPNTQGVSVNYTTADGTARTANGDYRARTDRTLTWSPGDTRSKYVPVLVYGDTNRELNERFYVNFSGASGAELTRNRGIGTIVNDDRGSALPSLSIGDAVKVERDEGYSFFYFRVTVVGANTQGVSVNYTTADGTARTSNGDYRARTDRRLTWSPGDTRPKYVPVLVYGDTNPELNERFYVNFSGVSGAELIRNRVIGAIVNDDSSS